MSHLVILCERENIFLLMSTANTKNDNTKLVSGGIEEQIHQVLKDLMNVLKSTGSSLEKLVFAYVS